MGRGWHDAMQGIHKARESECSKLGQPDRKFPEWIAGNANLVIKAKPHPMCVILDSE